MNKLTIERLSAGDPAAFDAVYHAYKSRLADRIFRIVQDLDETADILQDVFLQLWSYREQLDAEQPIEALLYHMATNRIYDHFRALKRKLKMEKDQASLDEASDPIERQLIHQETHTQLQVALERLPLQCQTVTRMFFIEQKSYKEITQLLGISKSTINNHLLRAKKILAKKLG